ncbi:MAG: S8 family serine peptidase [Ferruginibacter sp.]|nr:S8 family serine peptidase [Chitinophagaceae bacterium]
MAKSKKQIATQHQGVSVVIKFHEFVSLPYRKGVEQEIIKTNIGPWESLQKEFPGISLLPLITPDSKKKADELIKKAKRTDPTYKAVDFGKFFYIPVPAGIDAEALVKSLHGWRSVEVVYPDYPVPDPVVNDADDPRAVNQDYLDAAPAGIDARYAWGFAGGDGAGQSFIDLERGWTLNHEDLSAHGAALLHGTLLDSSRSHGTSVLGEICSVDNTIGCVGIVPNVSSVNVVSYHLSTRVDAIIAAISNLVFGDVLLLEAQVSVPNSTPGMLGPIEVLDADYEAIRLATALGIIVVEAGGNGTNNGGAPALNLDTYQTAGGLRILFRDPSNPDFRDSGAIIVTAASSAAPHTRLVYGPHGRRIDCYAWAQNINTTDSDDAGSTNLYRTNFSGTSGASPIITGAALAVQGIAQASPNGFRFSPRQMRAILSNPATGTAPAATETTLIGVMPNLRDIIDDVLTITPDIYIRDFVGDSGLPHTGSISASPDIIVRPVEEVNPQTAFGAGSGTENSSTLGYEVEAGQDNFIYARVLNQGGSNATNVNATVYWSEVSTLVTPDMWTEIGSVNIPTVPVGEVLTVSNKITWNAGDIPGTGHYCFVGIIGTVNDPAPLAADFLNWDNFTKFIRENNNVTWRNFNVVDNDPSPDPGVPKGYKALPFIFPGAPDKSRNMQLKFLHKLPEGAKVFLEVPQNLKSIFGRLTAGLIKETKYGALIPLKPHGTQISREILLKARSRNKIRLLVHIPDKYKQQAYEVAVIQLWEKQEVGRVSWRLISKKEMDERKKKLKVKR